MGCCGTINTGSYVIDPTNDTNNDKNSSTSNIEDEKYIYISKAGKGYSGKSIKVISDKTNIYYIIKIIEEKKNLKMLF